MNFNPHLKYRWSSFPWWWKALSIFCFGLGMNRAILDGLTFEIKRKK